MLGGETSGSEPKGVMQWTGLELKAKLKMAASAQQNGKASVLI